MRIAVIRFKHEGIAGPPQVEGWSIRNNRMVMQDSGLPGHSHFTATMDGDVITIVNTKEETRQCIHLSNVGSVVEISPRIIAEESAKAAKAKKVA